MSDFLNLSKDTDFLDLSKAAPNLKRLRGIISWDMHPVYKDSQSDGFDLDIFLFVLGADGKLSSPPDVCFFNNKVACGGALTVPEDCRSGGSEYFTADLAKIPVDRTSFDVFVFLFEAEKRGQHFGMITNAKFVLVDPDDGDRVIQQYNISQFTGDFALHVGSVVRKDSGWIFQPMGESGAVNPNEVAAGYRRNN